MADQEDWPDIYIDESVSTGGVGSQADPYSDFSEINWTTGGDNSIYDHYNNTPTASVTINLKKGETWREEMVAGTSGSATYPIIIRAYGSGADPIIDTNDLLDNSGNWSVYSGDIWQHSNITRMYNCWIDDTVTTEAADKDSVNATNKSYYDSVGDILYVYATSNPATAYTNPGVQVNMAYDVAIGIVAESWITIEDLELQGSYNYTVIITNGGTNIVIDNCTIKKTYFGILVRNATPATQATNTDITISNCTLIHPLPYADSGNDLIKFGAEVQDSIVSNCTFTNTNHTGVYMYPGTGTTHAATSNNIVENNTFEWDDNSYWGRAFSTDGKENMCTGNIFRYNYIKNQVSPCQMNANGNYIYYNVWDGSQLSGAGGGGQAIHLAAYSSLVSHDNYFYNNVLYNLYTIGFEIKAWGGEATVEDHVIKNNIIMNCDANGDDYQIKYWNVAEVGDQIVTNNCLYSSATSDVVDFKETPYTVAEADANVTGWDNNIQGDPLFVNPSGDDFHLQSGSPCRNAGIDVSLTQDYDSVSVPQETNPAMGAYEYIVGRLSDYAESKSLAHIFKNTSYSQPANLYIALCKSTIEDDDTGSTLPSEISGGAYSRKQCNTWDTSGTQGHATNDLKLQFSTATAEWGIATDFAICDATSGGNMLCYGKLSESKHIHTGDIFIISTDDLDVSLN